MISVWIYSDGLKTQTGIFTARFFTLSWLMAASDLGVSDTFSVLMNKA